MLAARPCASGLARHRPRPQVKFPGLPVSDTLELAVDDFVATTVMFNDRSPADPWRCATWLPADAIAPVVLRVITENVSGVAGSSYRRVRRLIAVTAADNQSRHFGRYSDRHRDQQCDQGKVARLAHTCLTLRSAQRVHSNSLAVRLRVVKGDTADVR
jgi:hypothetical protein